MRTARPARSVSSASSSGRDGLSRRVKMSSSGNPASLRPMWAVRRRLARSARCASSSAIRAGRSAQDHSTRRSTDSNTRSRSSSGAATMAGGSVRPRRAPSSCDSRFSSAGQAAPAGTAGTLATSALASSSQAANGVSPPTSMPAHRHPAARGTDAVRKLGEQAGLPDAGASPVSTTTCPAPSAAAFHAAVSAASSCARPNSGVLAGRDTAAGSCDWTARVAGEGFTPSSSRSCWANRRAVRTAPARSPAATSRCSRARCAASSNGASTHRCLDQATASAARPSSSAAAASSSSARNRRFLCSSRAACTQSSSTPGSSSPTSCPAVSSAGGPASASTHSWSPRNPIEFREPSSTCSAAAPQDWRTDQIAVRRLARALASGTSGHSRAAR